MLTTQTGKAEEAYVWMRLIQNNMYPYLPVADRRGVDVIVETLNGQLAKLQVKSRGSPLPDKGSYGEQIKELWWEPNKVAFEYLVIVLPKAGSQEFEAWVVPETEVRHRLSPRGDLTMTVSLLREEWKDFHEKWDVIG